METIPSEVGAIEINQEDIQLCQEESSIGVAVGWTAGRPIWTPVWNGKELQW